ncbi:unnamed protein product [Spirodela intermedia]|uniref:Chromo domain-containing protein n=1 Tax=Spirodela intermedia TaxID=51605 RepID=A0A7I8IXR5_SPIIN|nr:unnamed protein product [Spirodela intermedia]CAA6662805.1 unnamed protein product [Spirodela intermedia]
MGRQLLTPPKLVKQQGPRYLPAAYQFAKNCHDQLKESLQRLKHNNELVLRYDGPFQIVARIGRLNVIGPRRLPPTVQAHYDQAATDILDHQIINKGGRNHAHRNTFYLVQWVERPREAVTWEKEVDLWKFEDLI